MTDEPNRVTVVMLADYATGPIRLRRGSHVEVDADRAAHLQRLGVATTSDPPERQRERLSDGRPQPTPWPLPEPEDRWP